MMNKIIYPDANEALSTELQGKFYTFIDNDKFYGHVKQASSNAITREMLEDCKPDKDHFLIHFTAVGDYEKYGFNKNADSFPKVANQKYFKTFETDAKLYREHKSDDPSKAIGIIKKAMYNPDMGRIEVAVWANIKKASAEYEKAKNGETLSCSMGMRTPEDRDNISGKLSKSPREYEPWMKQAACQYIDEWDGKPIRKYAFVHNDNFRFFDLSIVARPAERIAHYLEYKFASDQSDNNNMIKAAAAHNGCIPSALLSEIEASKNNEFGLINKTLPADKLNLLKKLASLEDTFNKAIKYNTKDYLGTYINNTAKYAFDNSKSKDEIYNKNLAALKSVQPRTLFRELAKRASVLSFDDFMNVIYNDSDVVKDKDLHNKAVKYASIMLIPDVFKNLDAAMCSVLPEDNHCCDGEEIFDAGSLAECCLDSSKDPVQGFMDELEDNLSLNKEKTGKRIIKITLSINLDSSNEPLVDTSIEKCASEDIIKLAKRYANEYALYKLAALRDISELHGKSFLDDITLINTIAQNKF